jgi:hypothetical protein
MCMKLVAIAATTACLCLGTGCLWANERSDSMHGFEGRALIGSDGHFEGGQAHVMGGYAGLYADLEANVRDAVRPDDPDTHHGIGLGLSLRGSLFGVLATDHMLERYLDLGAEAGVGGGFVPGVPPHSVAGMSAGWYGAWIEVGTISLGSGYLALTGGIRREVFEAPWIDQTQLTIGLAWRKREPMGELHFHD